MICQKQISLQSHCGAGGIFVLSSKFSGSLDQLFNITLVTV